ncbi:MAG: hypothetical protein D6689_22130 [Deltaproteobacteria bacterium]|nr:MAG: hypothetical protein D6689_22130 [Deltaproteobacteria bacterium]
MRASRLVSLGVVSAALAALSACGDGGPNCLKVTVNILSPSSGSEITQADDTGTADGVQVDVRARVDGVEPGDTATLTVNGTAAGSPATVDANNEVTFDGVTLPEGEVDLVVTATNACDETGSDSVSVFVVGDLQCQLAIVNPSVTVSAYPQPVLNAAADDDADTPGFQATARVTTSPGYKVELFVLDVGTGAEASAGTMTAGDDGVAAYTALTLAEGVQAIRAQCVSPGGGASGAAPAQTFFVDSVAPTCAITSPAAGATIIPDDDEDPDTADTQITLAATVTGGDTEGEPATFTVNTLEITGAAVDASGATTAVATLSSPGAKTIGIQGQDHALNPCTATADVTYVTEGCSIAITAPTGTVTMDADPGTPGFQVDIDAMIDTECAGQTATTTCENGGGGTAMTAVGPGGAASFRVTGCTTDTCETSYDCAVSVTSPAGIVTTENLTVSIDNQGPGVTFTATGAGGTISCGTVVGSDVDLDPGTPGTQIDVLVLSQPGATRSLTQNGSPVTLSGGGAARVTLSDGDNDFAAEACDSLDNCSSTSCGIRKAELSIAFSPPFVTDAVLGSQDGTAGAGTLTLDVCGTVGSASATVSVTITPTIPGGDGPATVTGTTWCRSGVVFPEGGPYSIQADGDDAGAVGTAVVTGIVIDVTGPAAPADLDANALDRQSAQITWTAPSDGGMSVAGYDVRVSDAPIDAGNFDSATVVTPPSPSAPGATEVATAVHLRPGTDYYFAVVAVDAVGNRSALATMGPLSPPVDFERSGVIAPPVTDSAQRFGESVVAGDFNDDGFDDLAVGAPRASTNAGAVHVFLGGPGGIGATPDVTITPSVASGFFGNALAALDWNGDGVADLAVGAPFQNNFRGSVFIFYGGGSSLFNPATMGPRTQDQADVTISPSVDLVGGVLGFVLAGLDFNGDGRDDLAVAAPGAFANHGMAVVLLGGMAPAAIEIDDNDAAPLNGVSAWRVTGGTAAPSGCFLGNSLTALGRIRGASSPDALAFGGNSSCAGGERAFIIAGRTSDPTGGYAELAFDPTKDLHVTNGKNATGFGTSFGSIATAGERIVLIGAHSEATGGVVYAVPGTAAGGDSTPLTVSSIATATLTNSAEGTPGDRGIGNAAISNGGDIDADGNEDLVITSADGSPVVYVMYGPVALSGTVDLATSADHVVLAETGVFNGADVFLRWGGDYNDDGLEDLVWMAPGSTPSAGASTSNVGLIEVLY